MFTQVLALTLIYLYIYYSKGESDAVDKSDCYGANLIDISFATIVGIRATVIWENPTRQQVFHQLLLLNISSEIGPRRFTPKRKE